MEYKNKRLSTYSFIYLFIALCYLEEHRIIDYNLLKEYIELKFSDGKMIMDEINWHLNNMISDKMIIKEDYIVISDNISSKDIMYIIKVNIDDFNTMVNVVNDFLSFEYFKGKEKELIKKKTV